MNAKVHTAHRVATYVDRLTRLLINAALNRFDHTQAGEDADYIYLVDADVVGFYMRPTERQARYSNLGFLKPRSDDEFAHAVLTGDYIFSGRLPGQRPRAGARQRPPVYLLPTYQTEVAMMESAVRAKTMGAPDTFATEIPRTIDGLRAAHQDDVSQEHLLRYLRRGGGGGTGGRLAPAEMLAAEFGLRLKVDERLCESWLRTCDRISELDAAYWNDAGERCPDFRNMSRDAEALALAEQIRKRIRAARPKTQVVLISGSHMVRAAFIDRLPKDKAFSEHDFWLRDPLQYSPCLNLSTLSGEKSTDMMMETIERVTRDAFVERKLETFAEALRLRNEADTERREQVAFAWVGRSWMENLSETFTEQRVSALEKKWADVAKSATKVLEPRLRIRRMILRKQKQERERERADAIQGSARAARNLRSETLMFDVFADLFRSAMYYRDHVRGRQYERPIPVLLKIPSVEGLGANIEAVDQRIDSVYNAPAADQVRLLRELYEAVSRESRLLPIHASVFALKAHRWAEAWRWADEYANQTTAQLRRDKDWGLPLAIRDRHSELEPAWQVRCVAGRLSGFALGDTYPELKRFAAAVAEYHQRERHWVAYSAIQSERRALDLFAMMQHRYGGVTQQMAVGGAPSFDAPSLAANVAQTIAVIDEHTKREIEFEGQDREVGQRIRMQLASNLAAFASLHWLVSKGPGHPEWTESLRRAEEVLHSQRPKKIYPHLITIVDVALALLTLTLGDAADGADERIHAWLRTVEQRHQPYRAAFDYHLAACIKALEGR